MRIRRCVWNCRPRLTNILLVSRDGGVALRLLHPTVSILLKSNRSEQLRICLRRCPVLIEAGQVMTSSDNPAVWKRYGVWVFTLPRPLSNSRIWRQSDDWTSQPTVFFRGIGVRMSQDGNGLAFKGAVGEWRSRKTQVSLAGIVEQCFAPSRFAIQRAPAAHRAMPARVTGYAVVNAYGLRYRSVGSLAILLGSCLVCERIDG